MGEGTRLRSVLTCTPVALSLVVLLCTGVLFPHVVDPGPGLTFYRCAVAVAGAVATGLIAVAAVRTSGRLRASWSAIAGTAALWTLAVLVALSGGPVVLAWGVLRPASALIGILALVVAPGVRRRAREWGLVLLDGWLVGGSVFLIGWVALFHTGSRWTGESLTTHPSLFWVPIDLLFVSVVSGLAMRTDRALRIPVLMMVLVSLLSVTGDCTWALTTPAFAIFQWLILMAALGTSTLSPRLDLWQAAVPDPARPRLVRWPQVAVVPGLAAAVTGPAQLAVQVVAVSVIVAMVAEILLVSRQNTELWEALQDQAARLRRLASSDTLTGLLNRHAFLELLDESLGAGPAAVLFLDLDGFKTVNDRHGHAAGDRLLVEAAQALRGILGPRDVAARLGGDEFAVLVADGDRSAACLLAARVTDRMRRLPSDVAGVTSASVGVAVGHGIGATQLLADADLAMYRAKADGGGQHAVYAPEMRVPAQDPARARN